jgi:hypothetical protein
LARQGFAGQQRSLISGTSDLIRAKVTLIAVHSTLTPSLMHVIDAPGKLIAATRSLISGTSDLIHATLSLIMPPCLLIASPYSLITLQRSLITPALPDRARQSVSRRCSCGCRNGSGLMRARSVCRRRWFSRS